MPDSKTVSLGDIDQAIEFIPRITFEIRILGGEGNGFEEELHGDSGAVLKKGARKRVRLGVRPMKIYGQKFI